MSRAKNIESIVYSFIRLRRGLVRDIHGLNGTLSHAQGEALLCISHDGQLSAKDLASKLCITPGAITQLVESLLSAGFINRSIDVSDRRGIKLSITAVGKKIIEDTKKAKRRQLNQLLEPLSDQEIQILAKLLNKITVKKGEIN